ncbi:unnamed protein product [Moneuplotes crassus]|uniref:Uncharacterized protein n=1 Tax=Euplotes crassus TaxID=5936 RepID=A0AAD1XF40_EUPCR|nr:unnamed protein product [Moneuplotes crassus]
MYASNPQAYKGSRRLKASGNQIDQFGDAMRTGISEYLQQKKRKAQEFEPKPAVINPFTAMSSGNGHSEADTAPSPTKKISIERRHADNYAREDEIEPDRFLELTPCRWNHTGWKYAVRDPQYFNHLNKTQNNIGVSQNSLNDTRKKQSYFKTQYMKSFAKSKRNNSHNVKKGIPNQANYLSECYPVISGGKQAAKNYQRGAHDSHHQKNQSLTLRERGHEQGDKKWNKQRYNSKDSPYDNQLIKKARNAKKVMHRRGRSKDQVHSLARDTHKFLRERNINLADSLSSNPSEVLKLLRVEKEKLKKTLHGIKKNPHKKEQGKINTSKLNQTATSFGFQMLPKKQLDGNRTFYSEVSNQSQGLSTLGGAFSNYEAGITGKDVFVWGGNVLHRKHNQNFNKKRTFQSEWQSAANNNGVFINK